MLSAVNSFTNCYPMNTGNTYKASFGSGKQADKSPEQNELPVITEEGTAGKLKKAAKWLEEKKKSIHMPTKSPRKVIYDSLNRGKNEEVNLSDEPRNTTIDLDLAGRIDELAEDGDRLKITQFPDHYEALLHGKGLEQIFRYHGKGSTIEEALDKLDSDIFIKTY